MDYVFGLIWSDYWAFKTPLYEEWIKHPDIRKQLEDASKGHGELPEELEKVILQHVQSRDIWRE